MRGWGQVLNQLPSFEKPFEVTYYKDAGGHPNWIIKSYYTVKTGDIKIRCINGANQHGFFTGSTTYGRENNKNYVTGHITAFTNADYSCWFVMNPVMQINDKYTADAESETIFRNIQ